ncbi:GNAT family N-acetyltransferase [Bowmanella dokdonensis]|uniref:GNAT family N-acetyltransferase n=1 Tax=Bowmanella dokdonensis TaxID=751969 RepID=A0A939DJT3_9ALTE|nr:GNAT family N-acetyltransferase [Bowmanella dokdonensis]MBN7824044.1 GNAT family N-acetyltransferase [Bowmanella dokdonensis]
MIKIRSARPEEAEELSKLALRSKGYWSYSADFLAACEEELRVSSAQLSDSHWHCLVAELDSELLGYALLDGRLSQNWELEALFVEPDWIGKGIGRRLMDAVKELMRQTGVTRLVIQGDPNADAFYLAAGARQIGQRESASIKGRVLPLFELTVS